MRVVFFFRVIGNFVPITQKAPRGCAPRGEEFNASHTARARKCAARRTLYSKDMWNLATCADGEPNVVPVAFKDVTEDGKLVAGHFL